MRLIALGAVALAGCVTVKGVLKSDGSGTLQYDYAAPVDSTEAAEKAKFTSPHVTVESLTIGPDHRGHLQVKFDDVTKLDTAKGFEHVKITRAKDGENATKLDITITNPAARPDMKPVKKEGPHITVTLPGKALSASGPNAKTEGDTVTWSMTVGEYASQAKHELSVRYATGGETAADAKPAEGK